MEANARGRLACFCYGCPFLSPPFPLTRNVEPCTEGISIKWTEHFVNQSVYIQHDPNRDWARGHFYWLSVQPGKYSHSEYFKFDRMWNDAVDYDDDD